MEDIVGVKLRDQKGKERFLITWGRVFDAVDPTEFLKTLAISLSRFGITQVNDITICDSLQEVSSQRYFYEAYFQMLQKKIPYGKTYKAWAKRMCRAIQEGKEIYLLN